ncbi:hypothetical protein DYQ86_15965 [Acidobacteria bacterium AB60]|nr:hypothetical protein DYQ86_15965 [Acidobacteria bacterium AB60]
MKIRSLTWALALALSSPLAFAQLSVGSGGALSINGSSGGSTNATSIQNVPISATAPTNGQGLVYNSTTGAWAPGAQVGNATQIQNRTVSSGAPSDQQVLLWSQSLTQWQPGSLSIPVAGSCSSGQYSTAISYVSAPTCAQVQYSQIAGAPTGLVSVTGSPSAGQIASFADGSHVTPASTTGSGNVVLATSPALSTPSITAVAFATLPACSGHEGTHASVTDSVSNTAGAIITGGGGYHVSGYCNGTNWVVESGNGGSGSTTNSVVFNTTGGASPGTTFNGSASVTVSPATIGALPGVTASTLPATCSAGQLWTNPTPSPIDHAVAYCYATNSWTWMQLAMTGTPGAVIADAGAGSGSGLAAGYIAGPTSTDGDGYAYVVTASSSAAPAASSGIITIPFSAAYPVVPNCEAVGENAVTRALYGAQAPFVTPGTTTTTYFTITSGSTPLAAGVTYAWHYWCKIP